MSIASEKVMAIVKDLTALANSITDPAIKTELKGLIEDWTVEAMLFEAKETTQIVD
jgi:hypothetical protein